MIKIISVQEPKLRQELNIYPQGQHQKLLLYHLIQISN